MSWGFFLQISAVRGGKISFKKYPHEFSELWYLYVEKRADKPQQPQSEAEAGSSFSDLELRHSLLVVWWGECGVVVAIMIHGDLSRRAPVDFRQARDNSYRSDQAIVSRQPPISNLQPPSR